MMATNPTNSENKLSQENEANINSSSNDNHNHDENIITLQQKMQIFVDEKKETYSILLTFIENLEDAEDDFKNLIDKNNIQQDENYRENFEHFLHLITDISNNHRRNGFLFKRVFRILKYYQDQIKQTFSNIEIFNIFQSNKLILLFLFENKIITVDQNVYEKLMNLEEINGHHLYHFFYPEIKEFVGEQQSESIKEELLSIDENIFENFDEKRHAGENDFFICSLIRQDLVEDFISHVNKSLISLENKINPSLFETNPFLIKNRPTLIEYSAFYGSIQIFRYLSMNNVELNPSLWLYVIHSKNAELIHILEFYGIEFPGGNYIKCLTESIKCHHNDIADYFKENYNCLDKEEHVNDNDNDDNDNDDNDDKNEKVFDRILKYHYYSYFPSDFVLGYELFYLCLYNYQTLIDLFIKRNEKNILAKIKNKDEIDVIYFLLMKQTKIDEGYFSKRNKLTKISIPPSITSIGIQSFDECRSLKKITIPSSVTSIEDSAFFACSSLTQITIPSSVTSIGDYAFSGCSSLAQIIFEIPSLLTSIGCSAFDECSSLINITIPLSVTSIKDYAFDRCSSLKKVTFTIPSSVTSIGDYAFDRCSSLTQIKIPSSVTSIGDYAFSGCSSLAQIIFEIPSLLTSIGCSAFDGCSSLINITIPLSVTSIKDYAFDRCSSLKKVTFTIPSSVVSIGKSVFRECSSLTQIKIPSSVTSIGDYAFSECSSLAQIIFEIPSLLTSIGYSAFDQCSSLINITIPLSVTSIKDYAFDRCSSLTEVTFTIPSSVTEIKGSTFRQCSSLTKVTIPSTVTRIESCAFYECSSLTEITIPPSVRTIGNSAFFKCTSLTKIVIPSSVTKIGYLAFLDCSSLNDISFDTSSKVDIGSYSFLGCPLTNTSDPSLNQRYANIDDYIINELIAKRCCTHVFKATDKNTGKEVIIKSYQTIDPYIISDNSRFIEKAIISKLPGAIKALNIRCPLSEEEKNKVKTLNISSIYKGNEIQSDLTGYILISEYMKNGDISDVTKRYLTDPKSVKDKINPTIRSKIIFGVASIMKNLHKMNVIHRDLKLEKVFLDENFEPKINVFSWSRFVDNSFELEMVVETPLYMAPEMFFDVDETYGTPVDVYSYAILLYQMFSNEISFPDNRPIRSSQQYMMKIGRGLRPKRPKNITDDYWELIQKCWNHDPRERPTFEEVVNILKDDKFALEEFGTKTDLEQLHEYQQRMDINFYNNLKILI